MTYLQNYFEVKQQTPWLWSIKDKLQVYCWLLAGKNAALLLDTGYGIGDLPGAVRAITDKPLTVAASHGHADHALGNTQFESVLIHPADFSVCEDYCGRVWRQKALDTIAANGEKVGLAIADIDAEGYLKPGTGNLKPLEAGRVFDLGGLTAQVVEMPGHTPGSVGIFVPEHRVLLTGDASNRACFMFLPESSKLAAYAEMLERTMALDFETHYVGHQDRAYSRSWFAKYLKVARAALAGKGRKMTIPGFEEYEILVSSTGGPILSPTFCAVAYTAEKI
jgi:glyoxylase-like metal-dependent hydrolase (beta-lactamase superfamily II)